MTNMKENQPGFTKFEIVPGTVILIDTNDLDALKTRFWYLNREKKFSHKRFVTSFKLTHGKYRQISLQTFLMNPHGGLIAKLKNKYAFHDYRRSNLILVNSREQSHGFGKRKGKCSSIYKGVSFKSDRRKWASMIKRPDGRQMLLGYFDCQKDAASAYNQAAREIFGDYAFQNLI